MGSPEDRIDNRLENLELLQSRNEHMVLHERVKRERKLKEYGMENNISL
jgi:hypothetical protein